MRRALNYKTLPMKSLSSFFVRTQGILGILLWLCTVPVLAQTLPLKLVITVTPPYPVSVSYYADHPQQVVIQMINQSRDAVNFRLVGSINGLDNNVKVLAKDRGASNIITLNPLESRLLSVSEIQDLFDARKLAFTGINYRRTQIDDGLPEGLYNICAYAVDASPTSLQLSEETCSNSFPVTNLEPPILITPAADATISTVSVQNILFTWSLPASAPPSTEYTLRMVEVVGSMNPNNALQAATVPVFFERTVQANTLLYGPADPPLVAGRKYAYMVTAKDPMQKAVFRNGGRSEVHVFTYGNVLVPYQNMLTNTSQQTDLFFTSPSCLRMINGKPSLLKDEPQKIFTDEENPVSLNWLWQIQTDTTKDFLQNPANITYNGSILGRYRISIHQAGSSKILLAKNQLAFLQYVQISFAEAKEAGMLDSAVYVADLEVFDAPEGKKSEKSLIKVSSCQFTLRKMASQGTPMVTLKGRLKYKFQNDPSWYPANSVSLIATYTPLAKPAAIPKKAYFLTDTAGNFTGTIERDSGDYQIHFTVNSPYYKTELAPDTINMGTYQKDAKTGKIFRTGYQKEIELGELITQVYSYDLTVKVRKGFPKFNADGSTNQLTLGSLDTLSIKPQAIVKDGMLIRLYRKSKPAAVPFYENGLRIISFSGGNDVLVAEGKTVTEQDPNVARSGTTVIGKVTKNTSYSVVRFKNLVVNLLPDDEYYLKAFPPETGGYIAGSGSPSPVSSKTSNTPPQAVVPVFFAATPPASNYNLPGSNASNAFVNPKNVPGLTAIKNETEELIGPEMRVAFDKIVSPKTQKTPFGQSVSGHSQTTLPTSYHFEHSVDYNLISTTPPMSRIKGRIVYSWPSAPNIVRPLRNRDVVVRIAYTYDDGGFPTTPDTKCFTTINYVCKPGTPPGAAKDFDAIKKDLLPVPDAGFVVGIGRTDNNGNFEFNIINHNPKGEYVKDAVVLSQTFIKGVSADCPGGDKNQKAEKQKTPGSIITAKKDAVYDDYWSGSKAVMGGDVMSFQDGMNVVSNTGVSNGLVSQKGMDFGQSNLTGGLPMQEASVPGKQANKLQKGKGPADDWDWEENELDVTTVKVVKRRFQITAGSYMGGNFTGEGDVFTIQAFQSRDFGTIKMTVNEEMNRKIRVTNKKASSKDTTHYDFSNARLLVYRHKLSKQANRELPEGEGTTNHPNKPLNPVSFDDKQNTGAPVEWVLDSTLACDKDGFFDLSKLKLLESFPYQLQVSADPAITGARFDAANADYLKLKEADDVIEVVVGQSRISGRLYDASSGKGVMGQVQLGGGIGGMSPILVVDSSGYFESTNAYKPNYKPKKDDLPAWVDNQKITLTGTAPGYNSAKSEFSVKEKGMNYFKPLQLEPGGTVFGIVKNEDNIAVKAYIEREDGYIDDNEKSSTFNGLFVIKVPDKPQKIKITPKDPAYFDSTIVLTGSLNPKNLHTIVLFRRKHRIQFNLAFYNQKNEPFDNKNVLGMEGRFKVTINNEKFKTFFSNGKGIVQMSFENVSVNNYSILIEDTMGDFIPQSFNLMNQESRTFQVYPIKLKQGTFIRGVVTLDGKPVKNAKVYADIQTSSNGTAYNTLQTFTYPNGQYVLKMLPGGTIKLKIMAVLDTNFTVDGAVRLVNMAQIPQSVDFDLKKIGDFTLNNLLGFPLTVENITPVINAKQTYQVTGLVDLSKSNASDFGWLDPNTKIRVKNVPVKVINGKALVDANSVELQATTGFKMKYKNKYNVYVSHSTNKTSFQNMMLTRTGEKGYLQAYTSITDNSFNYPSTYLQFEEDNKQQDIFYLGTLASPNQSQLQMQNRVLATDGSQAKDYRLAAKDGKGLEFKFIGFNIVADPKSSYIDSKGAFHLNVNVTGDLIYSNQKQPINFRIPDLVLDNNTITPAKGSTPLVFDLQEWKLEVRNWTMDPQQGGLVSTNCLVKTGVVDVPAGYFNLRHNFFVLNQFDPKNITLGGGLLKLEEVSTNANLLFDEKCGSDLKGHWRLAITGNGPTSPAAKIKNLTPFTKEVLNIDFIQLISYNGGKDNLLSLGTTPAMKDVFNNSYLRFTPRFIASSTDNFALTGDLEFAIPRVPVAAASIKFTKPTGLLKAELQSISTEFEGLGNVKFKAGNQLPTLTGNGLMSLTGQVVEPGKFNPIPCVFQFGGGQTPRIFLPGATQLPADGKNNFLTLTGNTQLELNANQDKNGMWVEGTGNGSNGKDWNNLRFSGTIKDEKNETLIEKPINLDFVVYGEVQVNSSEVKVSNINTPLGSMKMVYNFADKELVGSMQILNKEMGSYKVDADVETRMGVKGFLLSGAASVNTGTLLVEGLGTFKMGFAVGNYPLAEATIQRVTQFSLDPLAKCWLENNASNFKGLYVTGGYNIIDVKKTFSAVVVSAYARAALGAEASFGFNKGAGTNVILRVGAFGKAQAGMSAITGTSISGSALAKVTLQSAYDPDKFTINGDADMTMGVTVSQSLLFDTLHTNLDINAGVKIKYAKQGNSKSVDFDYHLGSGTNLEECPK